MLDTGSNQNASDSMAVPSQQTTSIPRSIQGHINTINQIFLGDPRGLEIFMANVRSNDIDGASSTLKHKHEGELRELEEEKNRTLEASTKSITQLFELRKFQLQEKQAEEKQVLEQKLSVLKKTADANTETRALASLRDGQKGGSGSASEVTSGNPTVSSLDSLQSPAVTSSGDLDKSTGNKTN